MMAVARLQQEPEWLSWLRERVAEVGSMQAVAEEVGISRTAISLLLAGKYTAGTDKVAAKITAFAQRDRVWCPHLKVALDASACANYAAAAMPMSDPAALKLWIACRGCPNRSGAS